MAEAKKKFGVVLRRGARYRYKNVLYSRAVPTLVDRDVRDHLVDDTGYFVDVATDEKGNILKKEKPQRKRARIRRRQANEATPLLDTGAAAAEANEADGAEV